MFLLSRLTVEYLHSLQLLNFMNYHRRQNVLEIKHFPRATKKKKKKSCWTQYVYFLNNLQIKMCNLSKQIHLILQFLTSYTNENHYSRAFASSRIVQGRHACVSITWSESNSWHQGSDLLLLQSWSAAKRFNTNSYWITVQWKRAHFKTCKWPQYVWSRCQATEPYRLVFFSKSQSDRFSPLD